MGILQPFTPAFAQLIPKRFLEMLITYLGLAGLTVGPDFALGRNRSGNLDALAALGRNLGFCVGCGATCGGWRGKRCAATPSVRFCLPARWRRLPNAGARLHGQRCRCTRRSAADALDPTANLRVAAERGLPADGVYATWAWIGHPSSSPRLAGVTNIGTRPTVGGTDRRVECHLFDFPPPGQSGDLYDTSVTLAFVQRLRAEERFASLDALIAQIQQDMAAARAILQNKL